MIKICSCSLLDFVKWNCFTRDEVTCNSNYDLFFRRLWNTQSLTSPISLNFPRVGVFITDYLDESWRANKYLKTGSFEIKTSGVYVPQHFNYMLLTNAEQKVRDHFDQTTNSPNHCRWPCLFISMIRVWCIHSTYAT